MSVVAGIDMGTLNVRVCLFDEKQGRLGAGLAEYPLHRRHDDPDYATQSHNDQMSALTAAMAAALESSGVPGSCVAALAVDATGSSVVPVNSRLEPLDDYSLWCDHRAWKEAGEITNAGRRERLEALNWCGGSYSSEWGFSKILHWLRCNPERLSEFETAMENCDMVVATLCGIVDVAEVPRSVCAMGHKWMWNPDWGGFPSAEFLAGVDPLLAMVRTRLNGRFGASDRIAGHLSAHWAAKLGLKAGIPVPFGALDAHWDAIGSGIRPGDVVNIIGTSTCIMAVTSEQTPIPGMSGVVPGSIHPKLTGIESGLAASGDAFEAIARRAKSSVEELSSGLDKFRSGETGLLRLTWDNGDRTVLGNPRLGAVTLGGTLTQSAQDELFATIESTAFHTRIIFERMREHGVPVSRVINGGGVPRRSPVLNQVYASVLNAPVLVPDGDVTSLGSAIFAFLAAGTFQSVEEAQDALCPPYRTFQPDPAAQQTYRELYGFFKTPYFQLGETPASEGSLGAILPALRDIATHAK